MVPHRNDLVRYFVDRFLCRNRNLLAQYSARDYWGWWYQPTTHDLWHPFVYCASAILIRYRADAMISLPLLDTVPIFTFLIFGFGFPASKLLLTIWGEFVQDIVHFFVTRCCNWGSSRDLSI